MRSAVATPVLGLILLAGAARAQPPADTNSTAEDAAALADLPGQVCLSNACGGVAVDLTGQSRARTVAEAISLGNAQAVRDLGGTPAQAMDAIMRRARARLEAAPAGEQSGPEALLRVLGSFMDISDGSTLTFDSQTEPNSTNTVGSIVRRQPDGSDRRVYLTDDGGGMITFSWAVPRPSATR